MTNFPQCPSSVGVYQSGMQAGTAKWESIPAARMHSITAECSAVAAPRSIPPTRSLAGSEPVGAEAALRTRENNASSSAESAGSVEQASLMPCTRSCRLTSRLMSYALHCMHSVSLKRSGALLSRVPSMIDSVFMPAKPR